VSETTPKVFRIDSWVSTLQNCFSVSYTHVGVKILAEFNVFLHRKQRGKIS